MLDWMNDGFGLEIYPYNTRWAARVTVYKTGEQIERYGATPQGAILVLTASLRVRGLITN